jgi:hypothetical protein
MSERSYEVINANGIETFVISFAEITKDEDDFGCLCTFPGNDRYKLSNHKLQALALLGAAVVLCAHEPDELESFVGKIDEDTFSIVLPYSIPHWIRDEIKRLLPND